jgi:hypothetical protein
LTQKTFEELFPNLGNWKKTSNATNAYNCVAFAASEDSRWWDCAPFDDYYWPENVPRDDTLATFIELYKALGYQVCPDGSLEQGCEKIVIYANRLGIVEHVARQLPNGSWTSKIGEREDIMHETPDSLAGDEYGQPICFMSRPNRQEAAV